MGHRSQIYIKIAEEKIAPLHLHWCSGANLVSRTAKFILAMKNQTRRQAMVANPHQEILQHFGDTSCGKIDPDGPDFVAVVDPSQGDCNHGAVFVDISGSEVGVAFMSCLSATGFSFRTGEEREAEPTFCTTAEWALDLDSGVNYDILEILDEIKVLDSSPRVHVLAFGPEYKLSAAYSTQDYQHPAWLGLVPQIVKAGDTDSFDSLLTHARPDLQPGVVETQTITAISLAVNDGEPTPYLVPVIKLGMVVEFRGINCRVGRVEEYKPNSWAGRHWRVLCENGEERFINQKDFAPSPLCAVPDCKLTRRKFVLRSNDE